MESKGGAGSEDFVAEVAGIFKTLNVLLDVLFHVAYPIRFEVTFDTNVPNKTFFDH